MRKTLFVGSWKTYKTKTDEVREFFKILPQYSGTFKHEVVLCPSFVHLETAKGLIPSNISLGAQDCSAYGPGPHTGDITAAQLKDCGVKYCIVGHAEKRQTGETDELINKKVKQCIANGVIPIVCFGETLIEYENNQTRIVLEKQMRDSLRDIKDFEKIVLCYMPMWTIGSGLYTTGEYNNIIADFMRKTVAQMTGNPMSKNFTLLFGGQITANNIWEYLEASEVDGVIFAIAALKPADLAGIVNTKFTERKYNK